MRIGCMIFQLSNLIFMIKDTVNGSFRNTLALYLFWFAWIINSFIMFLALFKNRPYLLRLLSHLLVARNLISQFNPGDKICYADIGSFVQYNQYQTVGIMAGLFLPITLYESAFFSIPVTLVYNFIMSYGILTKFYKINGVENYYAYVYQ